MTVKTLIVDAAVLAVFRDNLALFRANDTHYAVMPNGGVHIRTPSVTLEIAPAPDGK